jgi:hypothetical protein
MLRNGARTGVPSGANCGKNVARASLTGFLNGFQIKRGQIFAGWPCDSLGLGIWGLSGGSGAMRRFALWLSLVPAVLGTSCAAFADYRITRDHGGYVHEYKAKYAAIRDRGERVIIDGICNSACTLVLGIVPMNKICVTPRASLGFHQAYYDKAFTFGIKVTSAEGTSDLMSYYPDTVKDWIRRNGGLTTDMKKIKNGVELWKIIDPCPDEW